MPKKNSTGGHGRDCVLVNGRKCTLHTTKPGMPKSVSEACWHCKEWRCADHCRCTRESLPNGRKPRKYATAAPKRQPRPVMPQPAPRPKAARVEEAVEQQLSRPVGRPAPPSCELLDLQTWWSQHITGVGEAAEVEVASYTFDDKALFDALARGLWRKQLVVNLYIDAEMLAGSTPQCQRSRLRELRGLGATVWRCKTGREGSYHCKALVLDRRVVYTGSANLTGNSRRNREMVFRMTGPVVDQVRRQLAGDRALWREWDGQS